MEREFSVVLIKPDGVERSLTGEIISRLERVGLKMSACKLVIVDETVADKHYGYNDQWFQNVGEKLIEFYKEHGIDPNEEIGTMEPKEVDKMVQER